jgi:type II secretory pathway component GspD/PulD (secretin)
LKSWITRWVIGLGLLAGMPWAGTEETVLEMIPLRHRTVEEVLPVLRALVEPEGAVSGTSGQIIVRAPPSKVARLRQVLASLDQAPRRLVITVTQDVARVRRKREESLSGSVSIGERGRIALPPTRRRSHGAPIVQGRHEKNFLRGQIRDHERTETGHGTQHVQVLEGGEAFIRVGQARPLHGHQLIDTPYGTGVIESHKYHEAGSGFYVRPRVAGNRVRVSIRTARERFRGGRRAVIETQSVDTEISAQLGEWIEIGGFTQSSSQNRTGILQRGRHSSHDLRSVYLKVEELR